MSSSDAPLLPSPDILSEFEHGKFALSNLAAKRARQIKDGAPPLVRVESNHALTIALAEIASSKIQAKYPSEQVPLVDGEGFTEGEEAMAPQLGLLLPALEAEEVEIIKVLDEEDHHEEPHEEQEGEATPTLSDLLTEEVEDHEEHPIETEEETLSLTDIAEQESSEAEEEESEE